MDEITEWARDHYENDHLKRPIVVGVMGDFSGMSDVEKLPLVDRRFLEISRQNFDTRFKALRPSLEL
ncbi:MAG: type VI secretion system contractile sheath small subunit, partial [Pseudomonadota bacterium]